MIIRTLKAGFQLAGLCAQTFTGVTPGITSPLSLRLDRTRRLPSHSAPIYWKSKRMPRNRPIGR